MPFIDHDKFLAFWRTSTNEMPFFTHNELISVAAKTFRQAFNSIRLLFYLAPPLEIDPLRLVPCPTVAFASNVFVYDGRSYKEQFRFMTERPYYAPIASTTHKIGLIFLEKFDRPLDKSEQQLITLLGAQLAHDLSWIRTFEKNWVVQPPLVLDNQAGRAWVDGQPLYLSKKEFGLLQLLYEYLGQPCPRELICRHIYAGETDPFSIRENRLDALISGLRFKLKRMPDNRLMIKTIRGVGYQLDITL
jgi:DNA-binding winged helix-turn-helix (wHTH) protein